MKIFLGTFENFGTSSISNRCNYSRLVEKYGISVDMILLQSKYERARRTCHCGLSGALQADRPCAVHTVAAAHANSYFNISPCGDNLDNYSWYVTVVRRCTCVNLHGLLCRRRRRGCVVCMSASYYFPHFVLFSSSRRIVPSKLFNPVAVKSQIIVVLCKDVASVLTPRSQGRLEVQ